jgi:excisionase family DNA binding protein
MLEGHVREKDTGIADDQLMDEMLTPREVARLLHVHLNTLKRWSACGRIKCYRISPRGDRRYARGDINHFLAELKSHHGDVNRVQSHVPLMTVDPASGPPGILVTVIGNRLEAGAHGYAWFDSDGDDRREPGEPSVGVVASEAGSFRAMLTVPAVAPGTYFIRADLPSGGPTEASSAFKVTGQVDAVRFSETVCCQRI